MEHLLNRLPERWEEKIIPLMTIHNKFVLGGSLALYILKMMEYDFGKRKPDLDFSLTEPFEEEEFLTLIAKAGYATAPEYLTTLLSVLNRIRKEIKTLGL